MIERLFPVLLRRPRGRDDARTDPFWEFGSFGLTGCHRQNLLHPENSRIRDGDRLAFIQGGPIGSRLIFVTPPVRVRNYLSGKAVVAKEICWRRNNRPLRYSEIAPLLADSEVDAPKALPELRRFLANVSRTTAAGKLASRFRARCEPLDIGLAAELIKAFERAYLAARKEDFIRVYTDAMPGIHTEFAATNRRREYDKLRADQEFVGIHREVRCRPKKYNSNC